MVTVRGRDEVRRFIASLPGQFERKVLRGAGRAAANVIADEARDRCISSAVKGSIKVRVDAPEGRVLAKVQTKGKGAYIAPWLEYGTSEHFISVDASQSGGRTAGRINSLHKAGSLVINGEFVGDTVLHPGAKPFPFLRPALDVKAGEAIAAAQSYINSRISRSGITGSDEPAGDEA
ncbi:MAG TPA: hypothetical protein VFJ46_17555 [Xanthobacteraceae bacterium]|nr:hypothetical protein [Xanthobacteraceae bacterium]